MAWAPSSAPFLRFSSRLSWLATSKKGARDHRNRSGTDFDPFKLFRLFPLSPSPSRLGRLPLSFLSTFVEHTKMKFQLALSTLLLGALSVQAVPHVEDKGLHARDGLSARGHAMFRSRQTLETPILPLHLARSRWLQTEAQTHPSSHSQQVSQCPRPLSNQLPSHRHRPRNPNRYRALNPLRALAEILQATATQISKPTFVRICSFDVRVLTPRSSTQ